MPNTKKDTKPRRTAKQRHGNNGGSIKRMTEEVKDVKYNDPNDRLAPEPVGSQVYNYSFSQFLGVDVPVPHLLHDNMFDNTPTEIVPSIMTLYLNPSPGRTGNIGSHNLHTAAINQQGLRTFTALSSSNAKTTQYSPQDVTMAILAVGELISTFEYARRCLGIAKLYNVRNRAYPRLAIEASGIDAEDLFEKLAQYRIRFNLLALQANKIPFPANIKYFNICRNLYRDIFLDEPDNPMAQTYMFVPYSTWFLDETTNPEGTLLTTCELNATMNVGGSRTFGSLLNVIEDMITALMSSGTLNYVYSDVLRMADKNNAPLFTIEPCPDDYAVIPIYSHEALLQIENATLIGRPRATESNQSFTKANDVIPSMDENSIYYQPEFRVDTPYVTCNRFINFDTGNPSLEDRVAATRFMSSSIASGWNGETFWGSVDTPDHYVVGLSVWGTNKNALTSILETGRFYSEEQSYYTKFKHHPLLINYAKTGSGNNTKFVYHGVFGDLAFWTTLDANTVSNIHRCAYFEMFELK